MLKSLEVLAVSAVNNYFGIMDPIRMCTFSLVYMCIDMYGYGTAASMFWVGIGLACTNTNDSRRINAVPLDYLGQSDRNVVRYGRAAADFQSTANVFTFEHMFLSAAFSA
jgi:hypothetical protein